jgi:hypothetical protein
MVVAKIIVSKLINWEYIFTLDSFSFLGVYS